VRTITAVSCYCVESRMQYNKNNLFIQVKSK
jgi:hypothetical protein